mgnify:CR=1 FL=1
MNKLISALVITTLALGALAAQASPVPPKNPALQNELGKVPPAARPTKAYLSGMDRPGNDLRRIEDFHLSPEACAALCNQTQYGACKAWVFVRPTPQQPQLCYLKNQVTPPVANRCCDTGIGNADAPN